MFGNKWDAFWKQFDRTMEMLPDAVSDAVSSGHAGVRQVIVKDGHVVMNGNFKSIRINGREIRIPKEIMEER